MMGVLMLKVKVNYFNQKKMGLFGNSRELQFRASKLLQKPSVCPTNKTEDKKEEVGRGCFAHKATGESKSSG